MADNAVVTEKKTRAPRGTGQTRQKREPETPEQKVIRIQNEIKNLEKEKRRLDLEIKKRQLELEWLNEDGKEWSVTLSLASRGLSWLAFFVPINNRYAVLARLQGYIFGCKCPLKISLYLEYEFEWGTFKATLDQRSRFFISSQDLLVRLSVLSNRFQNLDERL